MFYWGDAGLPARCAGADDRGECAAEQSAAETQRPTLGEAALQQAREAFEPRWNRWNALRTACATLATVPFLLVLLRV